MATPEIKATPKVGYMPPEAGPFRCGACQHYEDTGKGSGCNDKEVIAELGAGKSGLAPVAPNGCCNEFKPQQKRGLAKHFKGMAVLG